MSNTLRTYVSSTLGDKHTFAHEANLDVTAYVGHGGRHVQFTIDMNICTLAPNQIRDLIMTLQNRLEGGEGYNATDSGECVEVLPLEEIGQ